MDTLSGAVHIAYTAPITTADNPMIETISIIITKKSALTKVYRMDTFYMLVVF